ncbi:hypothetical protein SAMN05660657_05210 [Geodermatophilus amargosae]|uniref:Uncharacterized protein n=1 Tax=Geodermatophilus amargosae TaxID=1296565 RepID=A0A1I7D277_9ACTN|nr:hypothetical protein SAMN05660657_05210 [Geodermatophilus amargosae]
MVVDGLAAGFRTTVAARPARGARAGGQVIALAPARLPLDPRIRTSGNGDEVSDAVDGTAVADPLGLH